MQFQPPCYRQGHLQTRLLKAPSSLALCAFREGETPASLGNLFQCLTALTVNNFFLVSSLNLPSSSLKPFPLVQLLHALIKSSSPAFVQVPFMYWNLLSDLFTENKFYKKKVLILSCCRSLKSYQLQCPFKLQNLGLQLSKNHNNKNEHGGIVVKQQCLQWFEGYLNPPPCKKISKNIAFHIIIAGGNIMKAGRKAILFSLNNFSCCI